MDKFPIKYQILLALALWIIWVVVILINTSMLTEIHILYNLKIRGVQIEADVIQASTISQALRYTYEINGKQYYGGGEKETQKDSELGTSIGSKIKITYDSNFPEVSKYGPIADNYQNELFALIMILIVAPIVIIVTIFIRLKIYLRKRALTNGSPQIARDAGKRAS